MTPRSQKIDPRFVSLPHFNPLLQLANANNRDDITSMVINRLTGGWSFPVACLNRFFFSYLQPKPHFQPSSKRVPTPATSSVTSGSGEQPPSYADFIVQIKKNPPAAPLRSPSSSKPSTAADGAVIQEHSSFSSVSTVTGGLEAAGKWAGGKDGDSKLIQKSEIQPEPREEGSCTKSDPGISLGPRPVGSGSSIIVSPRQVSSF